MWDGDEDLFLDALGDREPDSERGARQRPLGRGTRTAKVVDLTDEDDAVGDGGRFTPTTSISALFGGRGGSSDG